MPTHSDSGSQHGDVAWREWDEESFRLARDLDRPILLDISAVWCHWCHVMDQTSYADPVVVDLIHKYYVPIRVDNDRRPDINERYNMGGWPTTAFLTPTGDILTGATYVPPEQMRRLLAQVADYYQRNKHDIYSKIIALRQQSTVASPDGPDTDLSQDTVAQVIESVHGAFDSQYGGFGDQPKFPHPDAIELALRDYQYNGRQESLTIASKTLDSMAMGGIYDPIEGGFFRYSTTRDWSIPHFEKMLEGNAGLLTNYVRAFQVTGNTRYTDVARDIMRYLDTILSDQKEGGFYGSQDADEEYYALPLTERRQRPAPYVDRTLYTDWNAMMISAYLLAAAVLGDNQPQDFALRTLEHLWRLCHRPDQGMYHYYDGEPHLPGLLTDQVHMGIALLDAYQTTGKVAYLDQALELAAFCTASLADEGGGFTDTVERADALGNLRTRLVPLPVNAVAARFFLRLHWLTGEQTHLTTTKATLARFGTAYKRLEYFASPYALAVSEMLRPPLKVVVLGDATDARFQALHAAALRLADPWKIVQPIDPQCDGEAFARSGFPLPQQPLAYPCVGTTCLSPVNDPARLSIFDRGNARQ